MENNWNLVFQKMDEIQDSQKDQYEKISDKLERKEDKNYHIYYPTYGKDFQKVK